MTEPPHRAVLVIGAGGLIGSHVARAIADAPVVVTHRTPAQPDGLFLDIRDTQRTRTLIRDVEPDVIVLAAAEPHVERCEREPEETGRVNVEAARAVADAARGANALLVVFSSEYVFEGSSGRYAESDPVGPINEYGRQKVQLEEIARSVPRHLICRTSGVFGWETARKNFVCQLVDRLRAGREFAVPSDQVITPTYAVDLAKALSRSIGRGTIGTMHVVGPSIVPRTHFAAIVCRVFGLPQELLVSRPTSELGVRAPRPCCAGLADDRLRQVLGTPLRGPAAALSDMRANEAIAGGGA